MPRVRHYATDAERQQAYRLRRRQKDSLNARAFDPGSAVINPWPRWRHLAANAESALGNLLAEMEEYQQTRSERWQESEKADEFTDRLAALTEVQEQIRDWIAAQ